MIGTIRATTSALLKEIPGDRMWEVRGGFSVGAPGSTTIRGSSGLHSGSGTSRSTGTSLGDFDARRLPGNPWRLIAFPLAIREARPRRNY